MGDNVRYQKEVTPVGRGSAPGVGKWEHMESPQKKWMCTECGYLHIGPTPPDMCPQCYVPTEAFIEVLNA